MIIRRAAERGYANHGWLRSFHSFSFADYYDPEHMGFRALRVINEDRVAPGHGFGTHSHRDMEIISYVLEGGLAHKDSIGTGSTIRPGDVQRMSAGTGVAHSEFNASESEEVHFLQIWILPDRRGGAPSYEQKHFEPAERRGRLRLIVSRDGREGSVKVQQDVKLYAALLEAGQRLTHSLQEGRYGWVQVARGEVKLNGTVFGAGDGAAFEGPAEIELVGGQNAELLVFDLA